MELCTQPKLSPTETVAKDFQIPQEEIWRSADTHNKHVRMLYAKKDFIAFYCQLAAPRKANHSRLPLLFLLLRAS